MLMLVLIALALLLLALGARLRTIRQRRAELRRRNAQRAVIRQQIADFTENCHVEAFRAKAARGLGLLFAVAVGAVGAEVWVW